jgi:hypothetical protein
VGTTTGVTVVEVFGSTGGMVGGVSTTGGGEFGVVGTTTGGIVVGGFGVGSGVVGVSTKTGTSTGGGPSVELIPRSSILALPSRTSTTVTVL